MMIFTSPDEWKKYCINASKRYIKNQYFESWLKEKKIDVYNLTTMGDKEIKALLSSIKKIENLAGMKLKTGLSNKDVLGKGKGVLLGKSVLKKVRKLRGKTARVFLVNRRVDSGNELLKFGDALTYVSDGITIFTFDPKIKYKMSFFRNEAKHEMCHLLGLNAHHEETIVDGYKRVGECLMNYNAPTSVMCPKCKDGFMWFWRGIKNAAKD